GVNVAMMAAGNVTGTVATSINTSGAGNIAIGSGVTYSLNTSSGAVAVTGASGLGGAVTMSGTSLVANGRAVSLTANPGTATSSITIGNIDASGGSGGTISMFAN